MIKMRKIVVLLLLFQFLAQFQAHQPKFTIKPIELSAGLLYHNLGSAQISNKKYSLLTYHNLTHIKYQVEKISEFYTYSINLCNSALAEHIASDCRNQLLFIKTKIKLIKNSYKIISHQIDAISNRKKRGLFDGVGDVIKFVFGNPSADDADFYSDSINQLMNNQKQTQVLMQQQVTVISETITNFNNSLYRLNENIAILNANLKIFHEFAKDMNNIKSQLEIESQIANHLILLIEMTDEILQTLENYVNDVSLIHHGIINYRILPPEQLYYELQKISTKENIPIPITSENIYLYYKIIELVSFIKNNILIIAFQIPIVSLNNFNLYHIFPLPTPHKQDNTLFSYIEPSKPFILVSPMRTNYLLFNELENCEEFLPKQWLCKKMSFFKKIDESECEIQLLVQSLEEIPKSCKTRNIIADLEVWHEIDKNQWLYAVSEQTQLSILCGEDPIQQEVISKIGILSLNNNCKAHTIHTTIESSGTYATSNLSIEIPATKIEEDDCCKKLKKNITLNSIHMVPLKLTNIDLHELKYAQHKLTQFDEQLQQQLNQPFIIKQSHWYTGVLSVLFGIILLVLTYNIFKWCGILQIFRRLFCCTREPRAIEASPCFQIFNQCHEKPVQHPIQVHYDVESQVLTTDPRLQENQEDASSTSSQSLRRSMRNKKVKININ